MRLANEEQTSLGACANRFGSRCPCLERYFAAADCKADAGANGSVHRMPLQPCREVHTSQAACSSPETALLVPLGVKVASAMRVRIGLRAAGVFDGDDVAIPSDFHVDLRFGVASIG